jgi:hypothetical protein
VLWYLVDVAVPPTPALRDRVARCLERDDLRRPGELLAVSRALVVLARWRAPRDRRVEDALERLSGALRGPGSPYASKFIDALKDWDFPLAVEDVRALFKREPGRLVLPYDSILDYIRSVRRDEYRALSPDVAALLKLGNDAIVLSALETLEALKYRLTEAEVASLLKRDARVRDATMNYLKGHRL